MSCIISNSNYKSYIVVYHLLVVLVKVHRTLSQLLGSLQIALCVWTNYEAIFGLIIQLLIMLGFIVCVIIDSLISCSIFLKAFQIKGR